MSTSTYKVTYERLGPGDAPDPEVFEDIESPDHLAECIFDTVRRRLVSSGIDVVVDLAEGKGSVYAGFRHVGDFTIEEVDDG